MDQQDREADADGQEEVVVNLFKEFLKDFYKEGINEGLDHIKFILYENKIFQRIREANQTEWKIVELCRELLFDNTKLIQSIREGIENDRKAIKEFG